MRPLIGSIPVNPRSALALYTPGGQIPNVGLGTGRGRQMTIPGVPALPVEAGAFDFSTIAFTPTTTPNLLGDGSTVSRTDKGAAPPDSHGAISFKPPNVGLSSPQTRFTPSQGSSDGGSKTPWLWIGAGGAVLALLYLGNQKRKRK